MTTAARARDNAQPGAALRFLARQPILTREEQLFGYELLFRDGPDNYFRSLDPDAASRDTLDSSTLMGLDVLCGGNRRAFVNRTREVLLKDYITLLPSNQAVVEILESVPPDDQVLAACQRLKEAGYWIALDDFAPNDPRVRLIEMADILKVDFRATSAEERAEMVKQYGSGTAGCWRKKSKLGKNSLLRVKAAFSIFRDTSFASPRSCRPARFPPTAFTMCRCCKRFRATNWITKKSKASSRVKPRRVTGCFVI